ncbi:type 2 periplasmic-binding domain-containing protein [Kineococcus esterisolvens]|uniref:hypothetical protein n=1 Tax=unclassified Kineococcus TaxID=2621656 RepID=UPI003D7C430C
MSKSAFSRRSLIAGAGGSAALLAAGGLTSCSSGDGGGSGGTSGGASATLPTHTPYTGVTPDLPGTEEGVDAAYYNFPADNPVSVPEKPGNGETLTGMANIYYAVPPGPGSNSYWAGLNERLGVDLQLQMVSAADYTQKFPTTIAGNDLPDMLQIPNAPVPNLPQLLKARFTDLSEHLSGDAINDYPNLANIPTRSWLPTAHNGGIYGVPIPRGAIGVYHFIRADLFEAAGVSTEPGSYEEFVDATKALTDPGQRRWAFSLVNQPRQLLGRMNGEPNVWAEDGGRLTHMYETEQYAQTVTDLIAMWKSGVMHPDSFNTSQPFKQLFNAGTVAINAADGYPGYIQYVLDNAGNPDFRLGLMPVHKRDGSGLAEWALGPGYYSINVLTKQEDPEKIKLALRVLNWLAAPFGTEEYLYRLYGEEGVDHTMDADGNPVLTPTGTTNTVLPIRYLTESPYNIYVPGRPQDAEQQHDYQSLEIPEGIPNPVVGFYSETAASANAAADINFNDGINAIIQERRPFSDLQSLISTWRGAAGDAMRNEYQDAMQAAGGTST